MLGTLYRTALRRGHRCDTLRLTILAQQVELRRSHVDVKLPLVRRRLIHDGAEAGDVKLACRRLVEDVEVDVLKQRSHRRENGQETEKEF